MINRITPDRTTAIDGSKQPFLSRAVSARSGENVPSNGRQKAIPALPQGVPVPQVARRVAIVRIILHGRTTPRMKNPHWDNFPKPKSGQPPAGTPVEPHKPIPLLLAEGKSVCPRCPPRRTHHYIWAPTRQPPPQHRRPGETTPLPSQHRPASQTRIPPKLQRKGEEEMKPPPPPMAVNSHRRAGTGATIRRISKQRRTKGGTTPPPR